MEAIKKREVLRKVYVDSEITWFVQAMLEEFHLVSVSLGDKDTIAIFYDRNIEEEVFQYFDLIKNFVALEFEKKSFIIF